MRTARLALFLTMCTAVSLVAQHPVVRGGQLPSSVEDSETPEAAIARLHAMENFQRQRDAALAAPRLVADDWTAVGPQGYPCNGGRLHCAGTVLQTTPHPTDPGTLYVAAPAGGLWKTTDGGKTWRPLLDHLPDIAVRAVTLDPIDPEIVYVATTTLLVRSLDGGSSWATLTRLADLRPIPSTVQVQLLVPRMTAGSRTRSVVYLRTLRTLFRSDDSGERLRVFYESPTRGSLWGLVVDPADSRRMWVMTKGTQLAVEATEDEGEHWRRLESAGASSVSGDNVSHSLVSGTDAKVQYFVGTAFNSYLLQLWKTTDGWATYSPVALPGLYVNMPVTSTHYPSSAAVVVHPQKPDTVCLGGSRLNCSSDGGSTWQAVVAASSIYSLAWDAVGRLVLGSKTGVDVTNTDLAKIQDLNDGLPIAEFFSIATHPTLPAVLAGGVEGAGALLHTASLGWANVLVTNAGGPVDFEGDGGQALYGLGKVWLTAEFYRCESDRCEPRHEGVDLKEYGNLATFAQDASRPPSLYLGLRRLYKSENRGDAWRPILDASETMRCITPDPTLPMPPCGFADMVLSIATAPSDPGVVYVGWGSGVVTISTNRGATWRDISPGCSGSGCATQLPVGDVQALVVDPRDPGTVYAGVNIGGPDGPGHVYRARNGGPPWQDISEGLPGLSVWSLAIDPTTGPPTVYVGTDRGVFRRREETAGWQYFSAGIPPVRVRAVHYNATTNTLLAATFGRGVYAISPGMRRY